METFNTLVCISQYFVNKQNVRSFGNIIKWNILKKMSAEEFCKYLFQESNAVSELPPEFVQILLIMRTNLMHKCKHEFKEYFPKTEVSYLQPENKEFIFNNCCKAIYEIIPKVFFGSKLNVKLFKNFIRTILYSMKKQHLIIQNLTEKWDISVTPWTYVPNPKMVLHHITLWVFKFILAPIICLNFYVTSCKFDANENKLYYIRKHHWQSFYDKQISKMVYTKVLQKFEPYCIGKTYKKNHSLASRIKIKVLKKDIPKLHLTLKCNNEYRPIVCYRNNSQNNSEKYKIKERLKFLRSLAGKPVLKIESLYNSLYSKWLHANKPRLYFVKTDLSNAFGSINREKLAKIISERYVNYLKGEMCILKKKRIAQQFKDLVTELRKPILIRAGSTVFEWKKGLVQGYKYSPALSELYYSYLDEIYFSNHLNFEEQCIKLFIRVVDDYLYITDSLEDALSFLAALSNYRNVNYDKTVVNFQHDSIKYNNEMVFLGYCYNTATLQVSRASNIYAGQMCYKITFSSGLSDLPKFIESRIGQSGIPINSHIFNLLYNNEELIWGHIFTTFCLSANKFCTILAVLCNEKEMCDLLPLYKKRVTVKLATSILETLMRNKPVDMLFVYCINHFRYLSWKALSLCAKLTPKCSGLVPLIQAELAKANCIFGKWKEHASRINTDGECLRKSMIQVCRRADLRIIFRNFETLPQGFECFHHRRLK